MPPLTSKQLHAIADWCRERQILPGRVTCSDVSAACKSLGIADDGDFGPLMPTSEGDHCESCYEQEMGEATQGSRSCDDINIHGY
jgi:hypothetical protein